MRFIKLLWERLRRRRDIRRDSKMIELEFERLRQQLLVEQNMIDLLNSKLQDLSDDAEALHQKEIRYKREIEHLTSKLEVLEETTIPGLVSHSKLLLERQNAEISTFSRKQLQSRNEG